MTHVLSFSRIYFEAFKISTDRISEFRLLCILLRCSQTDLKVNELRANPDIRKLLGVPEGKDSRHKLEPRIDGLKNRRGPFLKLVRTRPFRDRYYTFNSNFDEAVLQYLRLFQERVIPSWSLPSSLSIEEARLLFKEIANFIETKHVNAWTAALKDFAALLDRNERETWIDQALHNSTYWVVILAAWKDFLGDKETLIDMEGFKREVYTTIGRPAGNVESVVNDLCAKGILEETADEHIYTLNRQLESVMRSYTETLRTLRLELPDHLARVTPHT